MAIQNWLRRGFTLPDGSKIAKRVAEDNSWQIYLTSYDCYALAVTPALFQEWQARGYAETAIFLPTSVGETAYY